jgi:hypothetical protein
VALDWRSLPRSRKDGAPLPRFPTTSYRPDDKIRRGRCWGACRRGMPRRKSNKRIMLATRQDVARENARTWTASVCVCDPFRKKEAHARAALPVPGVKPAPPLSFRPFLPLSVFSFPSFFLDSSTLLPPHRRMHETATRFLLIRSLFRSMYREDDPRPLAYGRARK